MFTTLIYKDADFHICKINEDGAVMLNGVVLDDETILHKSSNGFMYVLLQKINGAFVFYPLDKVIYNSFNPSTQTNWDHFKCVHIDGNNYNNNLYNLDAIYDPEIWRPITFPGIEPNKHSVSSYGRIAKTMHNGKLDIGYGGFGAHINETSYMARTIYLPTFDAKKNSYSKNKCYPIHRLVAHEFIGTIMPSEIINHIDGNPMNNYIDNLEITSQSYNVSHSILIHSNNRVVSNDMWFAMEKALIKFKGNMIESLRYLLKNGINVTHKQLTHAKYDLFRRRKYLNLGQYHTGFEVKKYRETHSDEIVNIICKTLCDNNGSVNKTVKQLRANNYDIEEHDIKNIKYKNTFSRISDEYFTFNDRNFIKL